MIALYHGDYTAQIDTKHGANCISLRNRRYEAVILREPPEDGVLNNPYLYGMPILFPVNRISGGRFCFEGREYRFPINEPATGCHLHGMLHRMPFEVVSQEDRAVECLFRASKEMPYLEFPHEFEIKIRYELDEGGWQQTTTVENLSNENMPCLLGYHTTFQTCFLKHSISENIFARVDLSKEFERNMESYLPTGRCPDLDEVSQRLSDGTWSPVERRISRHYLSGGARRMVLYDRGNDVSMVYENDEKLPFRLIYGGGEDPFLCMEPQTCLADCANAPFPRTETGFDYIPAGRSKVYISRIMLLEGDHR